MKLLLLLLISGIFDNRDEVIQFLSLHLLTIRTRHYLTSNDLPEPDFSALKRVLDQRSDLAYIEVFSFDVAAFDKLMDFFEPEWISLVKPRSGILGGRPRKRNARLCLALTLLYSNTDGSVLQRRVYFAFKGFTSREGNELAIVQRLYSLVTIVHAFPPKGLLDSMMSNSL